jgi:hypothetical protein
VYYILLLKIKTKTKIREEQGRRPPNIKVAPNPSMVKRRNVS